MARQRVAHGAELDIPTNSEIAELIAQAFSREHSEEHGRIKGIVNLDGTGAGNSENQSQGQVMDPVDGQHDWKIERITLTGANALVALYENQIVGTDLLAVVQIGAAGLYSDGFSNNIYVTANTKIIVAVTGGPANGQVTYNLQVRRVKRQQG